MLANTRGKSEVTFIFTLCQTNALVFVAHFPYDNDEILHTKNNSVLLLEQNSQT